MTNVVRGWWQSHFAGQPCFQPPRGSWIFGLLLAAVAAVILFPDNQPLLEPDEGRQAEIPREMLARCDFVTPRIQGLPYYEKPPLQYWLTAGVYSLFGVRPWVARLVPAGAAWLTILLTFGWAARVLGARQAFLGGLILSLSLQFAFLGRTVILDSLLTLCVVTSWFAAHQAIAGASFRWRWWVISAVACGLGILAKGPVALILLIPPVFAYQLLMTITVAAGSGLNISARASWYAWVAYLGMTLLVTAPWYLLMVWSDRAYLVHFFWKANVVRFVNAYDHEQPWWFYVPVVFLGTFPWSLLWPALGYFLASRRPQMAARRSPSVGFCVLLAGWCLLFYSASGCKSPPYVMPALVPLALLLGSCLDAVIHLPWARDYPYLSYARRILPFHAASSLLVFSFIAYLIIAVLGWQAWPIAVGQAVVALVLILGWWRIGPRLGPLAAWGSCAAVISVVILFPLRDLGAGYAAQHSPAAIVRMVRRWPGIQQSPVVSFQREWLSASFYLHREIVGFYGEHIHPELMNLMMSNKEVLVLVENGQNLDDFLKELPQVFERRVVVPDQDGTVALVVVKNQTCW
jgi:dolichol-phosphate mannosyltransferase